MTVTYRKAVPDDTHDCIVLRGLTRENGRVFREKILSIGHSRDLAAAYREFRGKDPSVEPLLEFRGLK